MQRGVFLLAGALDTDIHNFRPRSKFEILDELEINKRSKVGNQLSKLFLDSYGLKSVFWAADLKWTELCRIQGESVYLSLQTTSSSIPHPQTGSSPCKPVACS